MKICTVCNTEKAVDNFYKKGKGCYRSECKSCTSDKARNYYKRNKRGFQERYDKKKKIYKKWSQSVSGRYSSYKSGAKKRGLSFELSKEEFTLFWKAPCHYCTGNIETIGLDRVDSSEGYKVNNVVPCCTTCNTMKNSLTTEEFKSHIIKLYTNLMLNA